MGTEYMSSGYIAILIDGGFFLKRLPRLVAPSRCESPEKIVTCLRHMCRRHVEMLTTGQGPRWRQHLYRIFFYDAEPFDGKAHHPIDNRPIDFGKSEVARERHALFEQLRKERKLALRLGKVTRDHNWAIDPSLTKKLLRTREYIKALDQLTAPAEDDQDTPISLQLTPAQARNLIALRDLWRSLDGKSIKYGLRQKGVDIRIGLDITTLTLKKQVDTIIFALICIH